LGIVHGTTIGLNAVLTRSGARLGVLVTKGFGDVLEIGRLRMPDPFSFFTQKVIPLVRRNLIGEVPERILASGEILEPLRPEAVLAATVPLVAAGVEAITICFMNAYRNPVHERAAREVIRRQHPGLPVYLASEVWPEIREYERAMVTVMDAYVAPRITAYLDSLETRVHEIGLICPIHISTSNGGMLPTGLAKDHPGATLLSGPAAGVIASAYLARACGLEHVLGFDMGGTSADIAVLTRGELPYSTETTIGDLPLILPALEVSSVGAGGGSIARFDNMQVLKVGPASAGAHPGPACYGRGGTAATITDAYLETGILDPGHFLGGRLSIYPGLAREALARLAAPSPYSVPELAEGILRVATANLVAGVARVEARKGVDLREFTLLAYGGAGPTQACFLAEELGMRRIAIPLSPGTFCAWGSLLADFRLDFAQTFHRAAGDIDLAALVAWFEERSKHGVERLTKESSLLEAVYAVRSADMRYRGQGYSLEVPVGDTLESGAALTEAFHRRYEEVYGVCDRSMPVDFMTARLTVVGRVRKHTLRELAASCEEAPTPLGSRPVVLRGESHDLPAFARRTLPRDRWVRGPCLIDQPDSTVLVHPGWDLRVDRFGTLHLEKAGP
jgi:N-methylhydantoinase A